MKEGAWSLGDSVSWRDRSHIIAEGSHHMFSTYSDLNLKRPNSLVFLQSKSAQFSRDMYQFQRSEIN
jgi:hypothetical protein